MSKANCLASNWILNFDKAAITVKVAKFQKLKAQLQAKAKL